MLWWIGAGLILLWLVLQLFAPRGWVPMLLIAGITLLIIQTAAYRKEKATEKHR
jgi:predicted benzoate:H+ symporter BenE